MAFQPRTDLLQQAKTLVVEHQFPSKSLLQRHLKIGYLEAVDLMARLQEAGVVTPVTFAGTRLLTPAYLRPARLEVQSPQQAHVRMLRDVALFMLETHEEGGDGHSIFIQAMLANGPQFDWKAVRSAAFPVLRDKPAEPVTAAAFALAQIPELAAAFAPAAIAGELAQACAAVERPIEENLSEADKRRRSYVRAVRYIEQRLLRGYQPSTDVFNWMPLGVPVGVSRRLANRGGKEHLEHVVPRLLLARRCEEMLRAGISVDQVALWVEPYMAVVRITEDEADYLDHVRGWKTCMPPGWEFDRDSIFARLHQAEIEFSMEVGLGSRTG